MGRSAGRVARRYAAGFATLALLAPLQAIATRTGDDAPPARAALAEHSGVELLEGDAAPAQLAAFEDPWNTPGEVGAGVPELVTELVTESVTDTSSPPPPPPRRSALSFAERYPAQAMAIQDPAVPATSRWALLIGINEQLGRVNDNIGSRQDAEDLRAHLLALGWRDDHILMLTDRQATRRNIVDGLHWLAEKTDPSSTAVFHYSGHSKKWYGADVDGDGEVTDEGLWPTDDRFIVDSELVSLLAPVDASSMWINFSTCNAAGFADQGLARPGRVLTFSSGEPQKSYEHPSWGNSVWGYLLIDEALRHGKADTNHDGRVSVEEASGWAHPHASYTTRGQRYGPQDAVIVDDHEGELHLTVPGVRPAPSPAHSRAPEQPAPAPAPPAPAPERSPQRETERHGGYLCLLLCD